MRSSLGISESVLTVRATDGVSLAATLYEPATRETAGVVLVNSGTGIPRGVYSRFAAWLAECGFAVLTWDYRGIGGSRPRSLRGFSARMRDWGEKDLEGVYAFLGERFGGRPVLVVGHSAGGQLVGLAPGSRRIAGLLAIAAQSGFYRHWPVPRRWAMAGLWFALMPAATAVAGYFPSRALGLGEDLPKGVALEWARWCRHRDYMVDDAARPLRPHFGAVRVPILCYSFADDPFAPRPAVEHLLSFYSAAPRLHLHIVPSERGIPPVGHLGFFKERFRDTLWAEALSFLRRPGALAA